MCRGQRLQDTDGKMKIWLVSVTFFSFSRLLVWNTNYIAELLAMNLPVAAVVSHSCQIVLFITGGFILCCILPWVFYKFVMFQKCKLYLNIFARIYCSKATPKYLSSFSNLETPKNTQFQGSTLRIDKRTGSACCLVRSCRIFQNKPDWPWWISAYP